MNDELTRDPCGHVSATVLVGRLTVLVQDHRPGWQLPRSSDLARRYQATTAQIDAAIAELAGRGIVRAMADGQVYRASPAESLITLDGLPCLGSRIDPMGTAPTCAERSVLRLGIPPEIARALRLPPPGSGVCAIQSTWAMDGTITAVSTTYLTASLAATLIPADHASTGPGTALNPLPQAGPAWQSAAPAALCLEVQPPPLRAARQLALHPGEPAITVAVRFDDPGGTPVALTVAVLHAARYRIAVETPGVPLTGSPFAAEAAVAGQHPRRATIPVGSEGPRRLESNGVSLDLDTHRVFADGTEITLTGKEYELLRALLENAGRVLSRRELTRIAWEPGTTRNKTSLEALMRRLRRKLDPGSVIPRIRTIHGVGYLFDVTRATARQAPAPS